MLRRTLQVFGIAVLLFGVVPLAAAGTFHYTSNFPLTGPTQVFYTFTTDGTSNVALDTFYSTADYDNDTILTLYNSNHQRLAWNDDIGPNPYGVGDCCDSYLSMGPLPAGTYLLRVSGWPCGDSGNECDETAIWLAGLGYHLNLDGVIAVQEGGAAVPEPAALVLLGSGLLTLLRRKRRI
jgi:hypothetical protein